MKNLPVGIQSFKDLREGNYLYIDKTEYIYELVKYPHGVYFLSRPRRFGKSLLISTLNEIFLGNKELFKGLWIYNSNYNWEKYPVIRIDFSKMKAETKEELKELINLTLKKIAQSYEIELEAQLYIARLDELIYKLSRKYNKHIVILIDEYDKPILDHIDNVERAVEMREILKGFYTVIKGSDEYIRFVLLTGVSKFSKAGVFSGLNNLEDITMTEKFNTILGITEEELEKYFGEYIDELSRKEGISREATLNEIREWYNGYCFSRNCERVYNPFSILRLFKDRNFTNYWFETGTPSFLINLLKNKNFNITRIPLKVVETSFTVYEVDKLEVVPLLFQTGYLTIAGYDKEYGEYVLDYPNREVKKSFTEILLKEYTGDEMNGSYVIELKRAINKKDLEKFFEVLQDIFHQIPYDIVIKKERYYQSIFYLIFTLIGVDINTEVRTDRGRIDAVVETGDRIYIFEFKLYGKSGEALQQIKEKKYYEKYVSGGKDIILIGAGFNPEEEKIIEYKIESII